jgi:transcription termination/antitermination protein NusA
MTIRTPLDDNAEIRRLLHEHVPEVASGVVEIKAIAREAGWRSMIAVHSAEPGVCPVSSCVGQNGVRVKAIVKASGDQLNIIKWSNSIEEFIRNILSPARIEQINFDTAAHQATITVSSESATTLTNDGGRRLGLASRLAGWDLRLIGI